MMNLKTIMTHLYTDEEIRDVIDGAIDGENADPAAPDPDAAPTATDQAYTERNELLAGFIALAEAFGCSCFIMDDTNESEGWRNVVCVELPTGQATWHIHDREMYLFEKLPHHDENVWDGHSVREKYDRVLMLQKIAGDIFDGIIENAVRLRGE